MSKNLKQRFSKYLKNFRKKSIYLTWIFCFIIVSLFFFFFLILFFLIFLLLLLSAWKDEVELDEKIGLAGFELQQKKGFSVMCPKNYYPTNLAVFRRCPWKLPKIAKNCQKLSKIVKNCQKLQTIGNNIVVTK